MYSAVSSVHHTLSIVALMLAYYSVGQEIADHMGTNSAQCSKLDYMVGPIPRQMLHTAMASRELVIS